MLAVPGPRLCQPLADHEHVYAQAVGGVEIREPPAEVILQPRAVPKAHRAASELAQALCGLPVAWFAALRRVDAVNVESRAVYQVERVAFDYSGDCVGATGGQVSTVDGARASAARDATRISPVPRPPGSGCP